MFSNTKLIMLAALLAAPLAQAKLPTNLNDCKAHTQNIVQVYAVAIACEKTQDAELEELVTRFAPANEDYLDACKKLGMTREIEKAWFNAEENKMERLRRADTKSARPILTRRASKKSPPIVKTSCRV